MGVESRAAGDHFTVHLESSTILIRNTRCISVKLSRQIKKFNISLEPTNYLENRYYCLVLLILQNVSIENILTQSFQITKYDIGYKYFVGPSLLARKRYFDVTISRLPFSWGNQNTDHIYVWSENLGLWWALEGATVPVIISNSYCMTPYIDQ